MIKNKVFKHGWFYNYRLHVPKTDVLCSNGLSPLKNYLTDVFDSCPNDYFNNEVRSSKLKMELPIELHHTSGHEMCLMADRCFEDFKKSHNSIQSFMLEHDNKTISTEVPLWLTHLETKNVIPNAAAELTGHIDLLRIENNKIWVWDFKPKAIKEKYAAGQTFMYSLMLSSRTGIPLKNFACGYYDENDAFVFQPDMNILKRC